MTKFLKYDLAAALEKDPAAHNKFEIILTYNGFKAIAHYRLANLLYRKKFHLLARMISQRAVRRYGVDIHPAAKIGKGLFIDHGVGVVIGETAEIGDNVTLYQGVTLGGTGKDVGKRHPTIENSVMISAGAKVLGPVTIGEGTKIGAGSVVLKNVPPYCTVVGVPGHVVRRMGEKHYDMDQKLPDPILEEFTRLNKRIAYLEELLNVNTCRFSITTEVNDVTSPDSSDNQ